MSFENPSTLNILIRRIAPVLLGLSAVAANGAFLPQPQPMNLGWNAVPESNVTNYKVYVGLQSRNYSQVFDAGAVTSLSINTLEFGQTYYFSVKAVASNGLEAPASDELVVTVSPPPLPVSASLTTGGTGTRILSWTFPKSAMTSSPEFIVYQSPDLVNWTLSETVLPAQFASETAQTVKFERPLTATGNRMFYRITARNWLGGSTGP